MKKIVVICLVLVMTSALVFAGADVEGSAKRTFVTIGTGGVTGVYYPAGGAISKMVNKKSDEYNLKATVESTGGSVFNVNAIMAGDLEFGVVQSDRQFQAVEGLAEWSDAGKQSDLRAICSLHPESVTLIAAVDAGIETIADLRGKRVNIGNPGSGQRQNAIDALNAVGIDWQTDIVAEEIKAAEAASMLQDDRIDAFFYTVGHPNGSAKEATAGKREVRFLDITGIDSLFSEYSYYAPSIIPIRQYPNAVNTSDVNTFGVKATFVTSADVPVDVVYAVTKEIFENLDEFKALHPAFAVLTKENMLQGLSAPLHEGALKYFKEVGLK